eukprot:m.264471 g.264471  ORF g.264471 m.264471 type:complete len:372 (-) comp15614_c1_seq1:1794-2909(-)
MQRALTYDFAQDCDDIFQAQPNEQQAASTSGPHEASSLHPFCHCGVLKDFAMTEQACAPFEVQPNQVHSPHKPHKPQLQLELWQQGTVGKTYSCACSYCDQQTFVDYGCECQAHYDPYRQRHESVEIPQPDSDTVWCGGLEDFVLHPDDLKSLPLPLMQHDRRRVDESATSMPIASSHRVIDEGISSPVSHVVAASSCFDDDTAANPASEQEIDIGSQLLLTPSQMPTPQPECDQAEFQVHKDAIQWHKVHIGQTARPFAPKKIKKLFRDDSFAAEIIVCMRHVERKNQDQAKVRKTQQVTDAKTNVLYGTKPCVTLNDLYTICSRSLNELEKHCSLLSDAQIHKATRSCHVAQLLCALKARYLFQNCFPL